jgi:hypothetical protein
MAALVASFEATPAMHSVVWLSYANGGEMTAGVVKAGEPDIRREFVPRARKKNRRGYF